MLTHLKLLYRYLVFSLFVICNAISCSVAVWNLSLAQSVGQKLQIDAFLIFLGAFGLFFTFAIIFIEILRKNAVTGRVWFEALWVGIFWIMELSGAAALTAIAPDVLCGPKAEPIGNAACTSTRVLLAFSWISTISLLVYLVVLLCAVFLRQQQDPQIWHADVRELFKSERRHSLGSAPNSPNLPQFHKPIPPVVAPQPRRAPTSTIYAYRSGLGPEYEIEHYRPSSPAAGRPVPPVPAAAPPHHIREGTRTATLQSSGPAPSLYPLQLGSSLLPQPRTQTLSDSPPPLGNWPRTNAVEQPLHTKRKAPPPANLSTFTFPATRSSTQSNPTSTSPSSSRPSSTPRRPGGPRTRSSSGEARRPPPLDLTKISAFRAAEAASRA